MTNDVVLNAEDVMTDIEEATWLCTWEWLVGEPDDEYTDAHVAACDLFAAKMQGLLERAFPNAEVWAYADRADYAPVHSRVKADHELGFGAWTRRSGEAFDVALALQERLERSDWWQYVLRQFDGVGTGEGVT